VVRLLLHVLTLLPSTVRFFFCRRRTTLDFSSSSAGLAILGILGILGLLRLSNVVETLVELEEEWNDVQADAVLEEQRL
jgi:hypothetical protein